MSITLVIETDIDVGDKIKLTPDASKRRWTVRDRDERFIVATTQAPFKSRGTLWYTIIDLTGWQDKRYNGAGNGVVRSSLNTLGGGWDLGDDGEGCDELIPALRSGKWDLSHRRIANVWGMETTTRSTPTHAPEPAEQPDKGDGGRSA